MSTFRHVRLPASLGAATQTIENAQRPPQISCSRAGQLMEALRAITSLHRRIAVAMADKLLALQVLEHSIEHSQRQHAVVLLDFFLDGHRAGLSSTSGNCQHCKLIVGRERRYATPEALFYIVNLVL